MSHQAEAKFQVAAAQGWGADIKRRVEAADRTTNVNFYCEICSYRAQACIWKEWVVWAVFGQVENRRL